MSEQLNPWCKIVKTSEGHDVLFFLIAGSEPHEQELTVVVWIDGTSLMMNIDGICICADCRANTERNFNNLDTTSANEFYNFIKARKDEATETAEGIECDNDDEPKAIFNRGSMH